MIKGSETTHTCEACVVGDESHWIRTGGNHVPTEFDLRNIRIINVDSSPDTRWLCGTYQPKILEELSDDP